MTVSAYCLNQAPAEALRYLIIHELAHYFESGHGPRFWALVARHVPDYKLQSRIIKAFHHQAVTQEPTPEPSVVELPKKQHATRPKKTQRSPISNWVESLNQQLLPLFN